MQKLDSAVCACVCMCVCVGSAHSRVRCDVRDAVHSRRIHSCRRMCLRGLRTNAGLSDADVCRCTYVLTLRNLDTTEATKLWSLVLHDAEVRERQRNKLKWKLNGICRMMLTACSCARMGS